MTAVVFDDGLDHQLPVGQVGQVGGEGQLVERAVALALGHLAGADAALQRLDDAVASGGDQRLGGLEHRHVDAGAYRDLGDAGAHLPGSDNTYSLDRCVTHSSSLSELVLSCTAIGPAQVGWAGPMRTSARLRLG